MASPTQNYLDNNRVSSFAAGLATGLIYGQKWGSGSKGVGVSISWSVPQGTAWFANGYSSYSEQSQWYAFSPAEIQGATWAMNAWASISGITASRSDDNQTTVGEIRFAKSSYGPSGSAAHAYYPGSTPQAGDIWMSVGSWNTSGTEANRPGTYAYLTLLHEVGHALGLKHPFETSSYNSTRFDDRYDHYAMTVMSYTAASWSDSAWPDFFPTTPMYLDMLAIQHLYGRDTKTRVGNTTYTFSSGQKYWETIYDAGGTDTIVYKGLVGSVIDLRQGRFSSVGDAITFDDGRSMRNTVCIGPSVVIEHATGGSGSDTLIGNDAHNTLKGNSGADTLKGGAGNDRLFGGAGDDRLYGGQGQDKFCFNTRLSDEPSSRNVDRVMDFNPVSDVIYLEDAVFKGIKKGTLTKAAFAIGKAAKDSKDRIIYDKKTGDLFYDKDGAGASAQIKFALLAKNLKLTEKDFYIV
ncbi:serralysin [Microvirga flocculans]|uniref:Serralysin n=1 Tax=Microvirga flocculans TaxID=217168 RepID=A0A7W6IEL7_9HYPH|nr:M10 family metallopeptidase [Microvirga flocculans]MBB4040042.1 serralysin [Microvirga flocculans]